MKRNDRQIIEDIVSMFNGNAGVNLATTTTTNLLLLIEESVESPKRPRRFSLNGITARAGLLWRKGAMINVPEADLIAEANGFMFAEQLVRHLEAKQEERKKARQVKSL